MDDVRALRLWRRRCEGTLGFLEELLAGDPQSSPAWRLKMRQHYTRLLQADLDAVPIGGDRSAVDYRARLKRCLNDG